MAIILKAAKVKDRHIGIKIYVIEHSFPTRHKIQGILIKITEKNIFGKANTGTKKLDTLFRNIYFQTQFLVK